MPSLWGKTLSRDELRARTGDMSQVARVRLSRLADGFEEGALVADCATGTGFQFTVLASRGLDISSACMNGRSLAWRSSQGDRHPAYYEPSGLGWLRSFPGGLVTTCGMTSMGAPDLDDGVELGLHGRFSNTPAANVQTCADWVDDDYVLSVAGTMGESVVFGENITLKRRITAHMGESRLTIEDDVENDGFVTAPHMLLYHVNIGFPVLDDGARVVIPTASVTPRDGDAAEGLDRWMEMPAPMVGFREKVYFHETVADRTGFVTAAVVNPHLDGGLAVYVRYRRAELPCLVQWKMAAAGTYVMGIEPANALVMGRSAEREAGRLQHLEPSERRSYLLEIGVLAGDDALSLLAH